MFFGIGRKLRKFYALMSRCPCPEMSLHGVLPRFLYPGGMTFYCQPLTIIGAKMLFRPILMFLSQPAGTGSTGGSPSTASLFYALDQMVLAASGMLFANPWPIPVGDEIWIYYAGIGRDHRQELKDPSLTGIFLARLRHDGVDNWPSESNEYLPMTHPWC